MKANRLFALAGLLYLFGGAAEAQQSAESPIITACRACHANQFETIAGSPHAAVDSPQWLEHAGADASCTACHGDVTQHVGAGGRGPVLAFADEPAFEQTQACNGCHADTHPQYAASPHGRAGLTCNDCHSTHQSQATTGLLKRPESQAYAELAQDAICADCHQANFAEFELNERHRLETVGCTSCHDSHAPDARSLLGGFKQQACAQCHLDKEGPFVFEHAASRVEGCTACHSPHGSPNRHLLTHQSTGELCFSCHAAVPQFHAGFAPVGPPRFGLDTQCVNCHVTIHGSNLDRGFLR